MHWQFLPRQHVWFIQSSKVYLNPRKKSQKITTRKHLGLGNTRILTDYLRNSPNLQDRKDCQPAKFKRRKKQIVDFILAPPFEHKAMLFVRSKTAEIRAEYWLFSYIQKPNITGGSKLRKEVCVPLCFCWLCHVWVSHLRVHLRKEVCLHLGLLPSLWKRICNKAKFG